MTLFDRIPHHMAVVPGDGLDHAIALLAVLETGVTESEQHSAASDEEAFGRYLITRLARDLIEHERTTSRFVPKEGSK